MPGSTSKTCPSCQTILPCAKKICSHCKMVQPVKKRLNIALSKFEAKREEWASSCKKNHNMLRYGLLGPKCRTQGGGDRVKAKEFIRGAFGKSGRRGSGNGLAIRWSRARRWTGSQAGGGQEPGGRSCWRGLGEDRVVRQAGGSGAGRAIVQVGARRGSSSRAGGGPVAGELEKGKWDY